MTIATFYADHTICADGKSWTWNNRHYHGLFAASNDYPLGSRVRVFYRLTLFDRLTSRAGRRVIIRSENIIIADKGGRRIGLDMAPEAFRRLVGARYVEIGKISVRVQRIDARRVGK